MDSRWVATLDDDIFLRNTPLRFWVLNFYSGLLGALPRPVLLVLFSNFVAN